MRWPPVIDLRIAVDKPTTEDLSGSPEQAHLADEIAHAATTAHCFVVVNHGIGAETLARLDDVTRRFFALPEATKRLVSTTPPSRFCGFATAADAASDTPNLVETFAVSRFDTGAELLAYGYDEVTAAAHPSNQWPTSPPELREVWRDYLSQVERLATHLMRLVAHALGAAPGWVDHNFDRHASGMIANYYPPQQAAPAAGLWRQQAHTDFGALTILYQDSDVGGLQVCDGEGVWRAVPATPDALVATLGDLVALWSADRWRASLHRVVNPPAEALGTARVSIPYFFHPNRDAVIEPITAPGGMRQNASIIHSGEWVARRERQTAG